MNIFMSINHRAIPKLDNKMQSILPTSTDIQVKIIKTFHTRHTYNFLKKMCTIYICYHRDLQWFYNKLHWSRGNYPAINR